MSLILCPAGGIAEAIAAKIEAGYGGTTAGIHAQDVGLLCEGFYPAWRAHSAQGQCTVVAASAGPFASFPQAAKWMRELLEIQREDAA